MFHLAGVNRASHPEAFWEGNLAFTRALLAQLADHPCPILFTSSILAGDPTPYGQSKLAAEEALLQYGAATGAEVFLYRLPHVFGRGSRPDYNSAVATFPRFPPSPWKTFWPFYPPSTGAGQREPCLRFTPPLQSNSTPLT